jgi:tetratricopeptide (TPR) repeat protein
MVSITVDHSQPKPVADVMQIDIRHKFRAVTFGAFSLLALVLYASAIVRPYLAARAVQHVDRRSIEAAMHLVPGDAEYPAMMGTYLMLSGSASDTPAVLHNLRASTELNPYSSHYWLNLARAYWYTGNAEGVATALRRAAEAEPTSPSVAWERALFYLAENDFDQALPNIRVAVANDPTLTADALRVCWSATQDASKMLALGLPATADVRLSFLHMMTSRNDFADAKIAWKGVLALPEKFDPRSAFDYLDLLLRNNRGQEAVAAWQELSGRFPALKEYSPTGGIVNAGFELDVLGGSFDWQLTPGPHVISSIDTETFHAGTRALCMTYEDGADDVGIAQRIPVEPNTTYSFSAWVKAESLLTLVPPRFLVYDPATQIGFMTLPVPVGSTAWRELSGSLRTGPTTSLVQLRINREQPASISGRLCVDDLALARQ